MRDCPTEWRFSGASGVGVNELVVFGDIGKGADTVLTNIIPARLTDFGSAVLRKGSKIKFGYQKTSNIGAANGWMSLKRRLP